MADEMHVAYSSPVEVDKYLIKSTTIDGANCMNSRELLFESKTTA